MQLSNYIKSFSYPEKPGYLLLYSTKKAAVILVPEGSLQKMGRGELTPEETATLSGLGFLVADPEKEKQEMLGLMEKANKLRADAHVIVVMNLDCNLACPYCFEGSMKAKRYMTPETAKALVKFIAETILPSGKSLKVTFYGGEPLLSGKLVQDIARRLRKLMEDEGRTFSFFLVTNGTLLTRKMVEKLLPLGLEGAQVTLDGPQDNHDRSRPFARGHASSFDKIFRNIKEIDGLIKINLSGNFTRGNYARFPELLDLLLREGITPDKLNMARFAPVTKPGGEFALPDFKDGCESITEPWLLEADLFLREEILKRGFFIPKLAPSLCMIEYALDMVVSVDGTLYKCPGFIGWKGLETGNLWEGLTDYRRSHHLDVWKKEECLNCEYLPLCFGGCRLMKLARDGDMSDVDCKRPYLEAVLEKFIRQDMKYRQAKPPRAEKNP